MAIVQNFKNEIVDIVNSMDLIHCVARAFSLYFQLVNILEQRVEEDRYIQSFTNKNVQKSLIILILLLQLWQGKMLQ